MFLSKEPIVKLKSAFLLIILFLATGLPAFAEAPAQNAVSLEEAIRAVSGAIGSRLQNGTRIAVVGFSSAS